MSSVWSNNVTIKSPSLKSFPRGKLPTSPITSFPKGRFPYLTSPIEECLPYLTSSHLTRLIIYSCHELVSFPDQELPNLTALQIFRCKKLRSLPDHMDSLRQLSICNCHRLVSFPETDQFTQYQE
ncbi:unnamed protein product [Dovyalis caffra]|uniref:Disease resistance protein n=1 Tax=Dovyalis caffra TaxID=77055 RepID=A0AAV1RS60_9ROSI|nr:unnamed protein product [Dovyalis caffra]